MLKAGPAGTPQSRSTDTPRRGGCVGAGGAAASLTDPSVPSLPGEPRLRLRSLLQPRPRSAHGGEVAGVGSVAQVGAGEPGREKSRGAPSPGCERLPEGSGRALRLKEVGGCNWERGAGGGTPGCLQWVLQPSPPTRREHPQSLPEICGFPPTQVWKWTKGKGKGATHHTPNPFVPAGARREARQEATGRGCRRNSDSPGEQSPSPAKGARIFWGYFHIPHPPFPTPRQGCKCWA